MKAFLAAAALSMVSSIAGCEMACQTGLAEGVLLADGKDLLLQATTGERNTIIWPSGYSVRADRNGLVLTDRFGSVKAREGDRIGVAGGIGVDNAFHGCSDVWIVPPSSTLEGAARQAA